MWRVEKYLRFLNFTFVLNVKKGKIDATELRNDMISSVSFEPISVTSVSIVVRQNALQV
jgi:hypothetical protein